MVGSMIIRNKLFNSILYIRSGYTDHPLSSIRSVIAQRLTASKQTSPHGHATAASDIGAIIRDESRERYSLIFSF